MIISAVSSYRGHIVVSEPPTALVTDSLQVSLGKALPVADSMVVLLLVGLRKGLSTMAQGPGHNGQICERTLFTASWAGNVLLSCFTVQCRTGLLQRAALQPGPSSGLRFLCSTVAEGVYPAPICSYDNRPVAGQPSGFCTL